MDEAWDAFADLLWAYYLAHVREDVTDALGNLEDVVRDGKRPTHAEIGKARGAIDQAEIILERYEELAPEE